MIVSLADLPRAVLLAAVFTLVACSESTAPTRSAAPSNAQFGKTGVDTTLAAGGGGGGGGSSTPACGQLSTAISSYNIVVYTTRIGIGVSGTAVNCGSRNVSFEVDVTDQNTDPVCAVNMPHVIASRNTGAGATWFWAANSTLVNCRGQTHTFDVRLWDTKTGQTLGTSTVSAFL